MFILVQNVIYPKDKMNSFPTFLTDILFYSEIHQITEIGCELHLKELEVLLPLTFSCGWCWLAVQRWKEIGPMTEGEEPELGDRRDTSSSLFPSPRQTFTTDQNQIGLVFNCCSSGLTDRFLFVPGRLTLAN